MTVQQLIDRLKEMPQQKEVIVQPPISPLDEHCKVVRVGVWDKAVLITPDK